MRITRDILRKVAANTAAERTRYNRHILCIFLTGSLLDEDPLLGGTADVDLMFVHDSEPPSKREIVSVTDDVHVDIGHLAQSLFLQPRALRGDAWLGSFVCNNPVLLHDTQHWFEFTQASVCAQFNQPENVLRRSRPFAEKARQSWMSLYSSRKENWAETVLTYLNILKDAANSIACLSGPPLTERRLMHLFPKRADAVGQPDLARTLAALYGGQPLSDAEWSNWLAAWEKAVSAAGEMDNAPIRLHPARRNYYRKASLVMWESGEKNAAVWPIIQTWTEAAAFLNHEEYNQDWLTAVNQLGLNESDFGGRMDALDGYLDGVEETLDIWAAEHGA
jgi:hypothetical protein